MFFNHKKENENLRRIRLKINTMISILTTKNFKTINSKNYNFDDDENENKPFKLGNEDEKYKGINYRKPIQLFNQTWLTFNLPVKRC